MRTPRTLLALTTLVMLVPGSAAAQRRTPSVVFDRAPVTSAATVTPPGIPAAAPVGRAEGGSWLGLRRLTSVFGGTALGAGLGYFASQVEMSDWDNRSRSAEGKAIRRRYLLSGAAAGATLGFVIPVGRAGGRLPERSRVPAGAVITAEDIARTVAANAYEAVQSLRPRWLVLKDVLSLGQAVGGAAAAAADAEVTGDYAILVYMDQSKLGGVETLREIDLPMIRYIRFYNGTEATYRWGWGHAHGVIYVSTTDEMRAE